MADRTYDVVVIGAGPVGQNVAERACAAGLSVVVVERELVGGECSYWACVPSKALLRPVLALADAARVDGAREAIRGPVDAAGVFGRRDRYVDNWDDSGQEQHVRASGADVIRGHGRLDGPRRVAVTAADGQVVRLNAAHAVVVCIGSGAALPELPGIATARPWTNREGTDSSVVPDRLAVVGGGGVAVEMATTWRGLGSSVTLLARGAGLLPRMEPFVGELVGQGLTDSGVEVRCGVSISELHRAGDTGPVTIQIDDGSELEVDEVLFATGRAPLTEDIGLDTVSLTPGTWLDVDDTLQVRGIDGGWLYAVGDANHRALLTHQGKYQARAAVAAIAARAASQPVDSTPWSRFVATADTLAVPQVFFTEPEAGSVGMTAQVAEQRGYRIQIIDVEIGETVVGAKLHADAYRGRARMVVDRDRGVVLGVTLVGPGVGEIIHSATIAVAGQVPIDRLWHAVPCFPTVSEVWLRLLEASRDAHVEESVPAHVDTASTSDDCPRSVPA